MKSTYSTPFNRRNFKKHIQRLYQKRIESYTIFDINDKASESKIKIRKRYPEGLTKDCPTYEEPTLNPLKTNLLSSTIKIKNIRRADPKGRVGILRSTCIAL